MLGGRGGRGGERGLGAGGLGGGERGGRGGRGAGGGRGLGGGAGGAFGGGWALAILQQQQQQECHQWLGQGALLQAVHVLPDAAGEVKYGLLAVSCCITGSCTAINLAMVTVASLRQRHMPRRERFSALTSRWHDAASRFSKLMGMLLQMLYNIVSFKRDGGNSDSCRINATVSCSSPCGPHRATRLMQCNKYNT
jgi:hypothetical protein